MYDEAEGRSLNFCERPAGIGTNTQVWLPGGKTSIIVKVCEVHWQALRVIGDK
jgi:hypothetical protein